MRFSSLDEWLSWQETLHPSEIDLGLARVRQVLCRMGREKPQHVLINVAGTNGKGSSVALLEASYRAAGYRVGAYTSPHFFRYNERIRINGAELDDATLCQAFEKIDQARGALSLTYFEFATLAAIECFAAAGLDVAIMEVGLGGRLDAVNVLDSDVALITSIAVDHEAWLGSDRETIATEKAGIMRRGRPVVCGDAQPPASIKVAAQKLGAALFCQGVDFNAEVQAQQWRWCSTDLGQRDALPWPALRGHYQLQNAAAVLMVLALLEKQLPLSQADIRAGLLNVRLDGRFQILPGPVPIILDVAHNPAAASALAKALAAWPIPGNTHGVVAMMADKDSAQITAALAIEIDHWHVADLDIARAAKAMDIIGVLPENSVHASYRTVTDAIATAQAQAEANDRIVVFGSFYTVAAVMAYHSREKNG